MTTPVALTIAGSDSSGGAGIQADLKTFAALGVYGASAITALTAQNTRGVTGIHPVPPEFVVEQIDAVFGDLAVGAVKIGMVAQSAVIEAIVASLKRWSPKHIVLDPVMVATSGDRLLNVGAVEALRRELIPIASIVTPNLPEAAVLLDEAVATDAAAIQSQGKRLLAMGCPAVLIKGGHGEGSESVDYLVRADGVDRAAGAARGDQKYPRHRLLAVVGNRGGIGEGRAAGDRGTQRQGVCQRGDCATPTVLPSATAMARCTISIATIDVTRRYFETFCFHKFQTRSSTAKLTWSAFAPSSGLR